MYDQVRIIYGPTGGRFTFLSGVIDAFETRLTKAGIRILDRVGISGGALSAAVRASGESFPSWLARASAYKENIRIGGSFTKNALGVWQLITTGGMLKSKTVLDTMFRPTAPLPPVDGDCWAVSWCKSSKRSVAFRLGIDMDMGLCLLASCAMPVAFSPVKIQNKNLPWRIRLELGVTDPYAYSTFRDGGLSPEFPGNLTGTNDYAPTIIINLDGKTPEDGPLFTRLCYGIIKSKTLEGIEEAAEIRPVEVINIPVPPSVDEFAARFDISEKEGMWQYRLGLKSGEFAVEEFLQKVDVQQHSQSQPAIQELASQPDSSQQHPSSCTEPHLSNIP